MNDDLPKGWAKTTLGQICSKPQYGWTCRAAKNGKIKYLRTSDISEGKIDWQSVPYCEEIPDDVEKYRVYPNDILVARAGSVGVSHRVRDTVHEAVFASYLIRFTALEGIEPRFIEFSLKSHEYWQAISDFAAGIAIPNVNATKLASLELPLAPLNEQNRIVAKLEKLVGKVDACQQRLAKIPVILKRFRQSVLAAACSGRLTADWREDAQYQNDFPVSWTKCKLSDISTLITKGASPKWQGVNYAENGVLFVTSENVGLGKMLLDTKKFVESKINEIQPRSVLQNGDVLTNIVGASIGRSAIFDRDDVANINQAVALIRLTNAVNRKYILYVLNSPVIIEHMESEKVDVARANLSLKDVGNYPIPLPPLSEQHEIIQRIELLFALADQIEARFAKAKARVDQMTQSLLAKAFRGELVPQDPNDEPASALLERIKAERTKGESEAEGGGKKRLNVNRKGKGG